MSRKEFEQMSDNKYFYALVLEEDKAKLCATSKPKAFLYSCNRVEYNFDPTAYCKIRMLGDHHAELTPIDSNMEVLKISVRNLEVLLRQLENYGILLYLRTHRAYAVNFTCIASINTENVVVCNSAGEKYIVPISKRYRKEVKTRIVKIKYDDNTAP